MTKFNLFSAIIILLFAIWNMTQGDLIMVLIDVGLLCAQLLLAILSELAKLNDKL